KLAGRVVDPDGRPISRAMVTIAVGDKTLEVPVNDDGRFATEYDGGAVKVSATAPEYQPGTVDARVEGGAAGEVDVVLVRAVRQGQLRGQVLSFSGKPLPAKISIAGDTMVAAQTAQADAGGNYTIDLPAGPFEV